MSSIQAEHPESHCIRVAKVFDWMTRSSTIQFERPVFKKKKQKIQHEKICRHFRIANPAEYPAILWEHHSSVPTTGTIWICNNSQHGEEMSVFVNHEFVFSVSRGQSRSITVAKLHSLAVTNEEKHEVKGMFHIVVHRKLSFVSDEEFDISVLENARCFFSDEKGYPLSSEQEKIMCREKRDSSERKRRRVVSPNGETILLQEIQFVQEGYVCIEFEDGIIGPFTFSHEETYLLYAPTQTIVIAAIQNAHCYREFLESNEKEVCFIVNLMIHFDMTIEVLKDENRSINGTFRRL
jgi:hypothetical protein